MQKLLIAAALLLPFSFVGNAQEKPPVHVVIQAAPEQIKKAALAMFARDGYSVDSDTASQLKISKPFTSEETDAYNTAHWTNPPVANCQHVHTFLLSPVDHAISVKMVSETSCHQDGQRLFFRSGDQKETQWMRTTLGDLKAKAEEAKPRR
jgi:hypothetical protein